MVPARLGVANLIFFLFSDFGNHSCVDTAVRIEAPSVFQFQE